MRSLRMRVFATVAAIVFTATAAAALLARRATLVEEQRMRVVTPQHLESLETLSGDAERAFGAGGWPRVQGDLRRAHPDTRFLAVDAAGHARAASDDELASGEVLLARADGNLVMQIRRGGANARFELNGVPTLAVRDRSGAAAGRVFVLPAGAVAPPPRFPAQVLPPWAAATLGTAAIALLITFTVSGRILRHVSALTDAARRMREGDLTVRVEPSGDDEIARLGRAFNDMAERLAQTERAKRQLVSDVAHELRSPVTNLRGMLESIQDGLAAPDPSRIEALHSEALLLQRLIADLQDLALAESSGLSLHIERVDVEAAARRAIGDAGGSAIRLSVDPDARFVRADAVRLEQMLRNLVSNARRHTPPAGGIEIHAARREREIRISVADSGCGIAAEHVAHVFDRFYRVDGSRDRATGGAGLGLAIVRRLAEAQGGSAAAASPGPGLGATFSIDLPAADQADSAVAPRSSPTVDTVIP